MAAIPVLEINPRAILRREPISDEAFCIVVDDFLASPSVLVDFASRSRGDFAHPNIGYPGIQLRMHDDSMKGIYRFVRSRMSGLYGFMRGRIGIRSLLSMVTLPPDELSFMQRICHVDPNPDSGREKYAAILYLFEDVRLGGTSFFRWRDEETVWQGVKLLRENAAEGEAFLRRQFATFREPPRYMTGSNEIAELLYTVPPRFNRFVFYSGDLPHSGAISAPELLSGDTTTGRLTLNLFFSVLPKTKP